MPFNLVNTSGGLDEARPILESYWVIPGRLLAGEYPAVPYAPEITRRRLDSFLEVGFDLFVNLTQADEVEDYAPILRERSVFYGVHVESLRYSIGDFGLPSPELMTRLLDKIDESIDAGHRIYLHCYGGIGRTGTTVGCYLVRHGFTGRQALDELAFRWKKVPKSSYHPYSPETIQQEEFVLSWSEGKDN